MEKIYIVGVGPGSRDYLLPIAMKTIAESDAIMGTPRLLEMFSDLAGKRRIPISGSTSEALKIIDDRPDEERLAILVSGDPCFFSLGSSLAKALPKDRCVVVPGISSVSLAFSRLGLPWQEGTFVSVHGRPLENLENLKGVTGPIAILTGGSNTPQRVASVMTEAKIPDRTCWILSNLGTEEETIVSGTLTGIAADSSSSWPSLSVMILETIS